MPGKRRKKEMGKRKRAGNEGVNLEVKSTK